MDCSTIATRQRSEQAIGTAGVLFTPHLAPMFRGILACLLWHG